MPGGSRDDERSDDALAGATAAVGPRPRRRDGGSSGRSAGAPGRLGPGCLAVAGGGRLPGGDAPVVTTGRRSTRGGGPSGHRTDLDRLRDRAVAVDLAPVGDGAQRR